MKFSVSYEQGYGRVINASCLEEAEKIANEEANGHGFIVLYGENGSMRKNDELVKRLNVTMFCKATYDSRIYVPEDISLEDAIRYAKAHINEIKIKSNLVHVDGSDYIDEGSCYFD